MPFTEKTPRYVAAGLVLSALVGAFSSLMAAPSAEPRPTKDAVVTHTGRSPTRAARAVATASEHEAPFTVLADASGRPSIVHARDVAGAPDLRDASLLEAARTHLGSVARTYGVTAGDIARLVHRDTLAPRAEGARIVRFAQRVDTTPILGREVAVVMDAHNRLVAVTGRLSPSSVLVRGRLALARTRVSQNDAVAAAHARASGGAGSIVDARVRRVLIETDGALLPVHQVMLEQSGVPIEDAHLVAFISAVDGTLLRAQRLTHADTFTYRVHADASSFVPNDSPFGNDATPHPTGIADGYQPAAVPAQTIELQNFPFSRNDAWLPDGADRLAGNAVRAYADHAVPDGFGAGDVEALATAPGTFDYTFDHTMSPTASLDQTRAATTYAFFTTSVLHDFFYDSGFDELAGNAQMTNFGRGGFGVDRLEVATQHHALDDRSLAMIPPDGQTPRLSFGVYGAGTATARDAAVDATIVSHEWGHLLSERLVGDALGLANAQGRAIGEGTSDFIAMLSLVRDEDRTRPGNHIYQAVYAIGGYVASATDANAHYFGLRRAPYSTDFQKNALTLAHVRRGQPLPMTHPIRDAVPFENALAHPAGEVWALALWEAYASLLNAYPYPDARDRMKSYLVMALASTPSSPTFTEARDALLASAMASDVNDFQRFATAFARRGLGFGSVSPDATSTDFVEAETSFITDNDLRWVTATLDDTSAGCDADGVLDVGETGFLTVEVENTGRSALAPFTATVAASGATATMQFPNGNTLSFASMQVGARQARRIPVQLVAVTGASPRAGLTLTASEPSLPVASQTFAYDARVHYDEQADGASDTFDTRRTTMRLERNGVVVGLPASARRSGHAHLADGPSRGTVALVTPPLSVTSALGVSIRMRHSLAFDEDGMAPTSGAVIEVSEDGVNFVDITTLGATPGYDGAVSASNPLGARPAFVGMSAGYPAYVTRTIALGTSFMNESVVLRVRVGSAGADRSAHGVDIDELTVTGTSEGTLARIVPETSDGLTCNRAPVANAGPDQTVTERTGDPMTGTPTVVTLSALDSFEPDGAPLTYTWTVLGAPGVTLDTPSAATTTFTVPEVARDTTFAFRVTVTDGTDASTDDVYVTVRQQNLAPVASLTGPASAAEGTTDVTLDASGSSDPDGDALTYTFTQTAGPTVTLLVLADVASFTAPAVSADTTLSFSLVVSDGIVSSVVATHDVEVIADVETPDAGTEGDASVEVDASVDIDASVEPMVDAGMTPGGGGGGCAAAGSRTPDASMFSLVLLAAALTVRRRARG